MALLGACRAPPAGDPAAPVRAYFEALEARDCEALEASVDGPASARLHEMGCARAFELHAEHPLALLEIESVVTDGRDPQLRLIRARLRADGSERVAVIGVRIVDATWRVVSI